MNLVLVAFSDSLFAASKEAAFSYDALNSLLMSWYVSGPTKSTHSFCQHR